MSSSAAITGFHGCPRVESTPYPWPWDGELLVKRSALLILHAPEMPTEDIPSPEGVNTEISTFAKEFAEAGGWVVTVQTSRPRVSPIGESEVKVKLQSAYIRSAGVDAFYGSPLDQMLRQAGRDQLLLTGTWLETSVHSTMRSANDRGYECLLLSDLAPAAEPELVANAVSSIEMSGGIFGAVSTSHAYREAAFTTISPTD